MDLAVHVEDLVKIYDGKVKALDGVSLSVEPGKSFALLGPNGAGKTTFMRILTTQIRPTSGRASVFGFDVVHEGDKVRRLISYVPQEMSVWTDISGYENLLIYSKIFGVPKDKRERIIGEVLEQMGLTDVKNDLVRTYSGGMIRRLEIACAMLIKPRIMFLDEPTIGLDPGARKSVWERLNVFKREYGVTIFFNTHYMDEADLYSDEIAIINRGKIVARGTAEELKRSLGGEMIILELKGTDVKQEIIQELRNTDFVLNVFKEGRGLSILVKDAERALPQLIDLMKNWNISMERISISKPTLDDVFLKYAGERLEGKERIGEIMHMRRMIKGG